MWPGCDAIAPRRAKEITNANKSRQNPQDKTTRRLFTGPPESRMITRLGPAIITVLYGIKPGRLRAKKSRVRSNSSSGAFRADTARQRRWWGTPRQTWPRPRDG